MYNDISSFLLELGYIVCGGYPLTWTGFSIETFSSLWEFVKLSVASRITLLPFISPTLMVLL